MLKAIKMKVYTVPLESKGGRPAVWDDVGSAEAYVSRIRDVAHMKQKLTNRQKTNITVSQVLYWRLYKQR